MVSLNFDAFLPQIFLCKEIWQKIFEGPRVGVGLTMVSHTIHVFTCVQTIN